MKIYHLSDTHQKDFDIKECDICIHTGDALNFGTGKELFKFKKDIEKVRHKCKRFIFIPGNHDKVFQQSEAMSKELLSEIGVETYIDEEIEIGNCRAIDSSYIDIFNGWAFEKSLSFRQRYFSMLPKADIVLAHSPPRSICKRFGCEAQEDYIEKHTSKIVLCGHDHENSGVYLHRNGKTIISNAAKIGTLINLE